MSSISHPFYLYSSMTETRNPTDELEGVHTKKSPLIKKNFGPNKMKQRIMR
jgi:hypothetical protein